MTTTKTAKGNFVLTRAGRVLLGLFVGAMLTMCWYMLSTSHYTAEKIAAVAGATLVLVSMGLLATARNANYKVRVRISAPLLVLVLLLPFGTKLAAIYGLFG